MKLTECPHGYGRDIENFDICPICDNDEGSIKYFDSTSEFKPLCSFKGATKIWLSLREQMATDALSLEEEQIYKNLCRYFAQITAIIGYEVSETTSNE